METKYIQSYDFDKKVQTVNKSIRICVNCGNISVRIENYGIFCKECGTFVKIKENEIE